MYRLIVVFVLTSYLCSGQPATEIYLFSVKARKGNVVLSDPRNISQHAGYDNQPFFHPGKTVVLFSSANDDGRTEIVEYDIRSGDRTRLTKTSEKEYSPTVTPDNKYISCIVQRDNGAQDLVKYSMDGTNPQVLIDNLIVGYHAWANENTVVVFTLPAPFLLQRVDMLTKVKEVIADSIGRAVQKIPGTNAISFTRRRNANSFDIKKYDPASRNITTILENVNGPEVNMCWTPDGRILLTEGDAIYIYDTRSKAKEKVLLKSNLKFTGYTRVAMSSDGKYLALVVNE